MFELHRMPPKSGLNCAVFVNYLHKSEQEIFTSAIQKLTGVPEIILSEIQKAPYADYVKGTCPDGDFFIFLDMNYGADIRAKSSLALDYVIAVLTR